MINNHAKVRLDAIGKNLPLWMKFLFLILKFNFKIENLSRHQHTENIFNDYKSEHKTQIKRSSAKSCFE